MSEKYSIPVSELSFEEAMKELENIVSRLESRDLALDKALELFKRGISLSSYCNKKLEEVQGLVKILTQNQGELEEVPMNPLKGE